MNSKILVLLLVLAAALWGCAADPQPDPTPVTEAMSKAPVEAENLPSGAEEEPTLPPESTSTLEPTDTPTEEPTPEAKEETGETGTNDTEEQPTSGVVADVIDVSASGETGAYQFSVTISSPDTGCDQYADWWEVLDEDGNLLYRRILAHSHVSEQPFTRSGGPVSVAADQVVIVRAHMAGAQAQPNGYGGTVFKGSVENGFSEATLEPNFAIGLEAVEPLPSGCGF
jgi:hypothetical protein